MRRFQKAKLPLFGSLKTFRNPVKVALKQLCLALADLVLQMPQTNDYLLALLRLVYQYHFELTAYWYWVDLASSLKNQFKVY